jgi:amino acid transporter
MIKISSPDKIFADNPWFGWALILLTIVIFVLLPNITHPRAMQWCIRACFAMSAILVVMYMIWFPVNATRFGNLAASNLLVFENWSNRGNMIYSENAYAWIVAVILPAWILRGFEVSIHLAEETKHASRSVATGMWAGTLCTYLIGILILVLMFACVRDIRALTNASRLLPHAFAEYLLQIVGYKATLFILILAWTDSALATAVLFMSAQRLTFALARDGVLPYGTWISRVSKRKLPVNAGLVVFAYSFILSITSTGGTSSFQALLAIAVVAQNLSYAIVIFTRLTYGRTILKPADWNLGRASIPLNVVALFYTGYLFLVLILPFWFPVEAVRVFLSRMFPC